MSQRYIPKVSKSPLKLALSLLFEKNPSARSALFMAGLGVAAAPLDWLFSLREQKLMQRSVKPKKPVIIVCGPPRSGTTLVAQYLINTLDVAYINNLTSIFPRSPITVNRWWGRRSIRSGGSYRAFYGKSRGFSGANDALYIWDRWLGPDRRAIPAQLLPGADQEIPAFFGNLEALYNKPVVTKINRMNLLAQLVAPVLPNAFFVFIERNPLWLAQSLVIARERIGGDPDAAYGTQHPDPICGDVIADVARQVAFHKKESEAVRATLGEHRCLTLSYEEFCDNPETLMIELERRLGDSMVRRDASVEAVGPSFFVSETPKLPMEDLERLSDLVVSGE